MSLEINNYNFFKKPMVNSATQRTVAQNSQTLETTQNTQVLENSQLLNKPQTSENSQTHQTKVEQNKEKETELVSAIKKYAKNETNKTVQNDEKENEICDDTQKNKENDKTGSKTTVQDTATRKSETNQNTQPNTKPETKPEDKSDDSSVMDRVKNLADKAKKAKKAYDCYKNPGKEAAKEIGKKVAPKVGKRIINNLTKNQNKTITSNTGKSTETGSKTPVQDTANRKLETNPNIQPCTKPGTQPNTKPETKPNTQSKTQSVSKTEPKPITKPAAPEATPNTKGENKIAIKPGIQPLPPLQPGIEDMNEIWEEPDYSDADSKEEFDEDYETNLDDTIYVPDSELVSEEEFNEEQNTNLPTNLPPEATLGVFDGRKKGADGMVEDFFMSVKNRVVGGVQFVVGTIKGDKIAQEEGGDQILRGINGTGCGRIAMQRANRKIRFAKKIADRINGKPKGQGRGTVVPVNDSGITISPFNPLLSNNSHPLTPFIILPQKG